MENPNQNQPNGINGMKVVEKMAQKIAMLEQENAFLSVKYEQALEELNAKSNIPQDKEERKAKK